MNKPGRPRSSAVRVRAYKEAPWRVQTRALAVGLVAVLGLAATLSLFIFTGAQAAEAGLQVQRLIGERDTLLRRIEAQQVNLARLNSVSWYYEKAEELGFEWTDPREMTFIHVPASTEPTPSYLGPSRILYIDEGVSLAPAYRENSARMGRAHAARRRPAVTAVLSTRVKIAGALLLLPVTASVVQLARFQIWPSQEREVLYSSPFPITRHIETPRGRVFDRNGHLLAGNLSHFRVYLDNCQNYLWAEEYLVNRDNEEPPVTMARILAEFMQATGVTVNIPGVTQSLQELDRGLRDQTQGRQRLRTCTLAVDVVEVGGQAQAIPLWLDETQETRLRVAQGELPDANGAYRYNPVLSDLRTEAWFARDYPEGSLASEVVGYSRQSGDRPGDRSENGVVRFYLEIGDWGVERFYNDILQGAREDFCGRSCRSRSRATWTAPSLRRTCS